MARPWGPRQSMERKGGEGGRLTCKERGHSILSRRHICPKPHQRWASWWLVSEKKAKQKSLQQAQAQGRLCPALSRSMPLSKQLQWAEVSIFSGAPYPSWAGVRCCHQQAPGGQNGRTRDEFPKSAEEGDGKVLWNPRTQRPCSPQAKSPSQAVGSRAQIHASTKHPAGGTA